MHILAVRRAQVNGQSSRWQQVIIMQTFAASVWRWGRKGGRVRAKLFQAGKRLKVRPVDGECNIFRLKGKWVAALPNECWQFA